jgi:hypothetical protein
MVYSTGKCCSIKQYVWVLLQLLILHRRFYTPCSSSSLLKLTTCFRKPELKGTPALLWNAKYVTETSRGLAQVTTHRILLTGIKKARTTPVKTAEMRSEIRRRSLPNTSTTRPQLSVKWVDTWVLRPAKLLWSPYWSGFRSRWCVVNDPGQVSSCHRSVFPV